MTARGSGKFWASPSSPVGVFFNSFLKNGDSYNLYYLTRQAGAPIKMNAAPLAATKFAWTPSDPGGVYEVYVTAVDPQGRESAPSKSRTNIKFPPPQSEGPGG